jgi:hypothetical protein
MSHSEFALIDSIEKDEHKLHCLAFFSIIVDFQWGKLLLISFHLRTSLYI